MRGEERIRPERKAQARQEEKGWLHCRTSYSARATVPLIQLPIKSDTLSPLEFLLSPPNMDTNGMHPSTDAKKESPKGRPFSI